MASWAKTYASGKHVELRMETRSIRIVIDGEPKATCGKVFRITPELRRGMYKHAPASNSKGEPITHAVGEVLLTAAEGAEVERLLAEHVREWDAGASARIAAEEARLEAAIPGLKALLARDADEDYADAFERMMEDEGNDGASPPMPPATDAVVLARQYPRAALYLRAEVYSQAANHHKASAGTKALALLESGGSDDEARAILENWLPAERMWD